MKEKFYNKNWFMWVMLCTITPVGIYLLWKRDKFNKAVRIGLSVFFGLAFLIGMVSSDETSDIEEDNTVIESNIDDQVEEPSEPVTTDVAEESDEVEEIEDVAEMSEELRENVLAFDEELWGIIQECESIQNELADVATQPDITEFKFYSAAEKARDAQYELLFRLDRSMYKEIKEYEESAKVYYDSVESYVITAHAIPDNLIKAFDTKNEIYSDKYSEAINEYQIQMFTAVAYRIEFLNSTALSEEEVSNLVKFE